MTMSVIENRITVCRRVVREKKKTKKRIRRRKKRKRRRRVSSDQVDAKQLGETPPRR